MGDIPATAQPQKTCGQEIAPGRFCTRRVSDKERFCWQHAHGIRNKLQSLTRNQTILFWIALIGIPIGIVSAYWSYLGSHRTGTSNGQDPIEISFSCTQGILLPMKIPPGGTAYILPLNKGLNSGKETELHEISNRLGDAALLWPDPQAVTQMKQRYPHEDALALLCDVANHGRDDLLDVRIPMLVRYGRSPSAPDLTPDVPWESTTIVFNPLDSGKTHTFYVVNDCPVEAQFHMPESGSARPVEEQRPRDFRMESQDPNANVQLSLSHLNAGQITCEQ